MPDFRRYFIPGGTYFFTLVTANRSPLFQQESARAILGSKIRDVLKEKPFELRAIVLLPDHLHAMWTLPPGDFAYFERWSAIKAKFTSEWLDAGGVEQRVSVGNAAQRRRGIRQTRFMEHTIRDEEDLHQHADYLHYNPVKHGYVRNPSDWPWSSFHRFVKAGDYPFDWGRSDAPQPGFSRVDESLIE